MSTRKEATGAKVPRAETHVRAKEKRRVRKKEEGEALRTVDPFAAFSGGYVSWVAAQAAALRSKRRDLVPEGGRR